MNEKKKLHYGWLVVLGLCAPQFFTIALQHSTASLYFPYITEELGISVTSLVTYMTINGIFMALTAGVASRVMDKIKMKNLFSLFLSLQFAICTIRTQFAPCFLAPIVNLSNSFFDTQSMAAFKCLAQKQNLFFSGAKQFKNREFLSRRNEKRSGILACIPEHFHDAGAEIIVFKPYVFLSRRAFKGDLFYL